MNQTLKLPRVTLQSLTARASKGASCNKMLPLTSLLAIEARGKNVRMITSDTTNFLYATYEDPSGDWDFYVVTQVDVFTKLISKLTCTEVTLEKTETSLVVRGNGTYEMALPLDDMGKPVVFPDPLADFEGNTVGEMDKKSIGLMLQTAKASVSTSLDVPCYTGYYTGDTFITTDTWKLCRLNLALSDVPVLLAPTTVDLFDTMTGDKVEVMKRDGVMVFKSPGTTLYSKLMPGIEDFRAQTIQELLDTQFFAACVVSKDSMLQALDRMSLFVTSYDDNGIRLDFDEDEVTISAIRVGSVETVKYESSPQNVPAKEDMLTSCIVDIEMLQELMKAVPGAAVKIEYGSDSFLRFSPLDDASVTQLLALKVD